ncbi:MAG: c-type cytochrome [Myxococcota bacterium]
MRGRGSRRVASLVIAGALGLCPLQARPADAARGAELFGLCASCHGADGGGNRFFRAPAIGGLPAWYVAAQLRKFQQGIRGAHPDDAQGLRMRPMSRTLRSDDDLQSVALHVAELHPPRPQPELTAGDGGRGAALYAVCSTCHGPDGRGNKAFKAPPLRNGSDWYLVEQIQKFKSGIRGGNPTDLTGIMMRPMALTLATDQAVQDVIAYVTRLEN